MRPFYVMCMTLVVLQVLDEFTTGESAKVAKINDDLVNEDSDGQQQILNTQKLPIIEKYDFESILKAMSYIFQNIKNEIIKQIAILLKRVTDMVKMSSVLMGSAIQQIGKPLKNVQETTRKGFEIISGVGNGGTNGMNNIKDRSASMIQMPMKILSDVGSTLPLVGEQFSKFDANTPMTDNRVKKSTDKTATKFKLTKTVDRQNDINNVEDVETFERKTTPKPNPAKAQQKTVSRKIPVPTPPKGKPDPSMHEEETVEDDETVEKE